MAADENFNGHVVRGLYRRIPGLDLVRVQDVLPAGTDDERVLRWAAESERVILSHDVATLVGYAYERCARGSGMPGVVAVRLTCPIGRAIDDLELLLATSAPGELQNRVVYIPL